MTFEYYLRSGNKMLRCGYTTGTCAALASAGAAEYLLSGKKKEKLSIVTGKGIEVNVDAFGFGRDDDMAWCSVIKDAGDDSDVTDGIEVKAIVSRCNNAGIHIDGGKGVGRVTKPGLDQPVGNAAINSTPRKMIEEEVMKICEKADYTGGLKVVITIPEGEKIAAHTFNSSLGVKGGLSILGTSGIVEPMSEQALIDTIEINIRQVAAESKALILTPGSYGETFIAEENLNDHGVAVVKCSNFIGESLDIAAAEHFEQVLLVGHIGKLIKVAAGIMNTHSSYADGRNEIFCAHTALCMSRRKPSETEDDATIYSSLMNAATTDACIELLDEAKLREDVMKSILDAVQKKLDYRVKDAYRTGAVLFSNRYGRLGITTGAGDILRDWKKR